MPIKFRTTKLRKICNSRDAARKSFGTAGGDTLIRRLAELSAAESLQDIRNLPAMRCHELKGNRKGQLACDVKHPLRIVFRPNEPALRLPDGGLDWTKITEIEVLEIVDYHD